MSSLGFIKLEISTAVPATGDGWIHEIKYDGYHSDRHRAGQGKGLFTPGSDWTRPYRGVVDACANLG